MTKRPVRATVFVGRWPRVPFVPMPGTIEPGTFSPTTATLISGATEAVLIDTLYLKQDVSDLGDLIERTGKRLTTIVITHAHADHYLGAGPLLERFPGAKLVATQEVIDSIRDSMESQAGQWEVLFGDTHVTEPAVLPQPVDGDSLHVDGSAVKLLPVGQADIHPTTIVHVPEIGLVVAGDSVYNEIHPMLGLSTPVEWEAWLDTLDVIEDLSPTTIVAGHRRPDGDDREVARMISETRSYITDFAAAFSAVEDAADLVDVMVAKYPHHGNVWTLQFSAAQAFATNQKQEPDRAHVQTTAKEPT